MGLNKRNMKNHPHAPVNRHTTMMKIIVTLYSNENPTNKYLYEEQHNIFLFYRHYSLPELVGQAVFLSAELWVFIRSVGAVLLSVTEP